MHALLVHIDSGGIQDTALPGTAASEATRLLKNGLSVSSFAAFEHFTRERTAELLDFIAGAPDLPPFHDLPEALQVAATKGVFEALRYRLNVRGEGLDTSAIVALSQSHAERVASTKSPSYRFSEWTFGYGSANVGAGVLSDFFTAVNAPAMFSQMGAVLQEVDFDYAAAGLADKGRLKLARVAAWRHEAAHDATLSIDVAILRTRITSYLAVAFAFDHLASLSVRVLANSFASGSEPVAPERDAVALRQLIPVPQGQVELCERDGTPLSTLYSAQHCRTELVENVVPVIGSVVVRDAQAQIVDWFHH